MTAKVPARPAVPLIAIGVVVSACGSPSATSSGTRHPTASSATATASAVPFTQLAGPVTPAPPSGPFAVVYTDTDRSSRTYSVLLVGLDGTVVAQTSATLPPARPNQTLTLSPVSTGASTAYYRDGATDIHELTAGGSTALVTTVPAAATAEMAFAVNPEQTSVAIALITESQDPSGSTVHAATQNLTDGGGRTTLYDANGNGAYTWPLAWQGRNLLLGVGAPCGNGGLYDAQGRPEPMPCVASIHTVAPDTASTVASICEAPNPEPYGQNDVRTLEGRPVAAGVACYAYTSQFQTNTTTCSLSAVSLSGSSTRFDSCPPNASYLNEDSCFLAPDGARMACLASSTSEIAILIPGGHLSSLGRKATILGWIDATHLLVAADASHLAVIDVASGSAVTAAVSGAAHTAMAGVISS